MWMHWAVSIVYHSGLLCCVLAIVAMLVAIVVAMVKYRKRDD